MDERCRSVASSGSRLVVADKNGRPLKNCDGKEILLRHKDRDVHMMMYTVRALLGDRALGNHNAGYAREVRAKVAALTNRPR